ncbi:hypothetical protein AB0A70_28015 [Streptomyces morookaense]|uniref:hypothetical protein n=1 Tax=Streptomyces morookaense TaxID=1970 RepID=UPI003408CB48
MNQEVRTLITGYLDVEEGYNVNRNLRGTVHSFKPEFAEGVREGLTELINTRELSTSDYDDLTQGIEFEDEDSLYEYLREMREYLFGDREEQPLPPA